MNAPLEIAVIALPDAATAFTPLSEHQEQTPATFFGAKPVLHASFADADVLLTEGDLTSWEAWRETFGPSPDQSAKDVNGGPVNGAVQDTNSEQRRIYRNVGGYITSESLILYPSSISSTSTQQALSIPYPSISLHAIQRIHASTTSPSTYLSSDASDQTQTRQALYLQLDLGDPATRNPDMDEDEGETVELLIVPSQPQPQVEKQSDDTSGTQDEAEEHTRTTSGIRLSQSEYVKHIFEALSRCADLHPDPASDEDVDGEPGAGGGSGGLAALLAGAGGGQWITAENAHEYEGMFGDGDGEEVGEDGQGEEQEGGVTLGPGAGSRRTRDDEVDGEVEGANGETKWQRTG